MVDKRANGRCSDMHANMCLCMVFCFQLVWSVESQPSEVTSHYDTASKLSHVSRD